MDNRYNRIEHGQQILAEKGGTNNMLRTSRLIISDQKAVYHVMSRTALDGFPMKDVEKDFMLDWIKKLSALYFTEILGFCLMGNHYSFAGENDSGVPIHR